VKIELSALFRRAMTAASLLIIPVVVLGAPPAFASARAASATVTNPAGEPIQHGGSSTEFGLLLPPTAACPGDTYHKGWLVSSYVAPASVSLSSVYYPNDYPNTGVDLVSTEGEPYVTESTQVTSGQIQTPPLFSWSRYDHDFTDLPPGSYNVGIACYQGHQPIARYWNVRFTFVASSSDPGGFTWTVTSGSTRGGSGHSEGPLIGLVVLVLAGGAVAVAVARSRSTRGRARRSRARSISV
jgi:hypothetical protein